MAHLSELNLRHLYSGKVRDLYEVDDELMLMVASDRLSAYDVVMNEPIPDKGRVLTGLTDYWVNEFSDVPSALVSCDPRVIDQTVVGFYDRPELHGRTMLVRRAEMLNLECVVRGRLAGQAYTEYVAEGTVHHMPAPTGMQLTDPFPEPIFTLFFTEKPKLVISKANIGANPLSVVSPLGVYVAPVAADGNQRNASNAIARVSS